MTERHGGMIVLSYPRSDSNRHWTVFETVASANWATGACNPNDTARPEGPDVRSEPARSDGSEQRRRVQGTDGVHILSAVSKRSITRKLAKTSRRLTSLRAELGTIDEQARMMRDEADDMAVRAIVAANSGVSTRCAASAGTRRGAPQEPRASGGRDGRARTASGRTPRRVERRELTSHQGSSARLAL